MPLNTTSTVSGKSDPHHQVGSPSTVGSGTGTVSSWCIFVKTVGRGFDDRRVNGDGADSNKNSKLSSVDGSFSFNVTVSPEDRIDFLHDEIEGVTGVEASQQRLIYRGRLIGKSDINSFSRNTTREDVEISSIDQTSARSKVESDQNALATCKKEQQEYRIKDIAGLCDGQTIHLVRKRDSEKAKKNISGPDEVSEQGSSTVSRNNENDTSVLNNMSTETEASGGGALLAALLGLETRVAEGGGSPVIDSVASGMSSNVTNNVNRSSGQAVTANSNRPATSSWRSPRANNDNDVISGSSHRHNRRPHYRLGLEDLEVPDPGSMESVRQGLMTLNTIMNSQPNNGGGQNEKERGQRQHPLEVNREWFRGQWIDARDTVNQWLEATIVDILDPLDVLNDTVTLRNPTAAAIHARRYGSIENSQQPRQRRVPNVDNDPAISANDLEGRRRLLLEECEPGDPREIILSTDTETDQPSIRLPVAPGTRSSQSFRPRSSNSGVKLLLIHYNGWPHRWDEWIRSDSERLRPFRTRTRHPNTSSMASPTPQSNFSEAPRTNIVEDGVEEDDRFAVLPELSVALSRVNELLSDLVQRGREQGNGSKDYSEEDELEGLHPSNMGTNNVADTNRQRAKVDLPWMAQKAGRNQENCDRDTNSSSENGVTSPRMLPNLDDLNGEDLELDHVINNSALASDEDTNSGKSSRSHDVTAMYKQRELRNLATLFDRLGRTLTDVAPHVASIAASLPAEEQINYSTSDRQDAPTSTESSTSFDYEASTPPLGGLLSLWSRERDRTRRNLTDQENDTTRPTTSAGPVDPDHEDFTSGIVNTSRGEVRSGPRNRASQQDDVASLLGTYLAAASLGSTASSTGENGSGATSSLARLLQRGSSSGQGDNGIDIHIHAIVTAPGVSPGGMGIATLSSGSTSPSATFAGARNIFPSNRISTRSDGGILRSGTPSSSNFVEPTDEEDYSDLFSELYSESPTPIDPNGSPVGEANSLPSSPNNINTDDGNTDNNCATTTLSGGIEQIESPNNTVVTTQSNRNRSAPRRQSRSGVFRLFRRRGSRANNQDGSNNENN